MIFIISKREGLSNYELTLHGLTAPCELINHRKVRKECIQYMYNCDSLLETATIVNLLYVLIAKRQTRIMVFLCATGKS